MVFAAGAFVIFAGRRIGADDKKFLACGKALMPRACRQDRNVTRLQLHNASAVSAELHLAFAPGNTKHFMDAGMVSSSPGCKDFCGPSWRTELPRTVRRPDC